MRCTLTKKVAVPAALLFRSISMTAARISALGAPTNVAPIYLLPSTMTISKYSNGSSISVSRSARKNAAKSGRFELEPSASLPTLHCCFLFFLLKLLYPARFCPFCLNHHLPLRGPETHSLQACLSLCPSSKCVLSLILFAYCAFDVALSPPRFAAH